MFASGDDPAIPDDAVEVGRVVGAWGVKGGLRIKPFAADPQALFATKRWFLAAPAPRAGVAAAPLRPSRPSRPAWPRLLRVSQAREQGEYIVASVDDLDDRDAAEALAGARVFVSRASFPTPAADEFYWVDLIGLTVRNREGADLGTVVGLLETGPTCVLRVVRRSRVEQPPAAAAPAPPAASPTGAAAPVGDAAPAPDEERLIPFVSAYVDRVDLAGRCVHVDWSPDFD